MKIIYWDIDGTLLNTGSAGLYAMTEVFQQLHGKDTPMPMIAAGGRTDNYICQQLLYKAHGVMPTDTEVQEFCRHYEATLLKWLRKKRQEWRCVFTSSPASFVFGRVKKCHTAAFNRQQ